MKSVQFSVQMMKKSVIFMNFGACLFLQTMKMFARQHQMGYKVEDVCLPRRKKSWSKIHFYTLKLLEFSCRSCNFKENYRCALALKRPNRAQLLYQNIVIGGHVQSALKSFTLTLIFTFISAQKLFFPITPNAHLLVIIYNDSGMQHADLNWA